MTWCGSWNPVLAYERELSKAASYIVRRTTKDVFTQGREYNFITFSSIQGAVTMGHIFISYSHKDGKYARKLAKALKQKGFDVWIDERIDYGTVWPKEIEKYLDECEAFIVVVSENSLESKWVQNEVTRAERKRKPIFPLLLRGEPWISIETTQYVDVRGGKLPPSKFYERLFSLLSKDKINLSPPTNLDGRPPKTSASSSSSKKTPKAAVQGGINLSGNVVIKNSKVAGRDIVVSKETDSK
jgi:hypothetical protein